MAFDAGSGSVGFPSVAPTVTLPYTTAEPPAVAVQPARFRVPYGRTILAQRLQFAAGKGPSGGSFQARWLRNGTSLGTITVTSGNVDGSIAAPANPLLVAGDLLTVEVTALGGATGAVVALLDCV